MKTHTWLTLIFCIVAAIALTLCASAADIVESGTCGDNVTWTLDSDGVLTVSGTGAMDNYGINDEGDWTAAPWYEARDNVVTAIIENGVVHIGEQAFAECFEMRSVTISNSVTSIGDLAFLLCENLMSVTISDNVMIIGNGAFRGCASLTSFTIPAGVAYLGIAAFDHCSNLTDIYYNGSFAHWKEICQQWEEYDKLESVTVHYNAQDIGVGITLTDKNERTIDGNGQTGETPETKEDVFQDGAEFTASFTAADPDAVKSSELVTANVFLIFYDRDALMVSLESREIDLSDPFNLMFVLDLTIPQGAKTLKFLMLGDNFEPLRAVRMIESPDAA